MVTPGALNQGAGLMPVAYMIADRTEADDAWQVMRCPSFIDSIAPGFIKSSSIKRARSVKPPTILAMLSDFELLDATI